MERQVKRNYDARRRREQSAETRQRIVDSARDLIVDVGYRSATIAEVASRAGVHPDTVYALVGRKPTLLRELIEQAISGRDGAIAAEDRDYVRAIRAEPSPREKLVIYSRAVSAIQRRMAPLFLALRDASATEPEALAVWEEISQRRATNMRMLAEDLRLSGGLREDLSIDDAADILWAMNSSEFYVLFTVDRGWSASRFERFLAEAWQRLLLG